MMQLVCSFVDCKGVKRIYWAAGREIQERGKVSACTWFIYSFICDHDNR